MRFVGANKFFQQGPGKGGWGNMETVGDAIYSIRRFALHAHFECLFFFIRCVHGSARCLSY